MRHESLVGVLWVLSAACLGTACSGGDPANNTRDGSVGEVRIALSVIPDDVHCLRITIAGSSRSAEQSFDVAPGQTSTALLVTGAPIGNGTASAEAFSLACSAVTPDSVADWVSDPAKT